jgi:hypothetical protein
MEFDIMRILLTILIFTSVQLTALSQQSFSGNVKIFQDPLVDSVLVQYQALRLKIMENPDHKSIPGYRIQIFFDSGLNSSDRARQARDEFMLLFPETPAYISWKAPNYRVRAGDFRTKLEAEKLLQLIIIYYPTAWVTKDEINFPVIN